MTESKSTYTLMGLMHNGEVRTVDLWVEGQPYGHLHLVEDRPPFFTSTQGRIWFQAFWYDAGQDAYFGRLHGLPTGAPSRGECISTLHDTREDAENWLKAKMFEQFPGVTELPRDELLRRLGG